MTTKLELTDNMDASVVSSRGRGRPAKTKEEKLPKLRYSQWFLTIVSNKHDSPEVREAFKGVIQEIFNPATIAAEQKYIRGIPESMHIEGAFEVGQRHRYPHVHLLIRAKHRGKLSFDFKALKLRVAEAMGHPSGDNVHLKSHYMRDNNATLASYINKYGQQHTGQAF